MSTDQNQKPRSKRQDPAKIIVLDYRGIVGSADNVKQENRPELLKNQPSVEHVGSPLIVPVAIEGHTAIVLQPGINVISREKWDAFMAIQTTAKGKTGPSSEVRHVKSLLESGSLTEIAAMPTEQFPIQEMIGRTVGPEGFEWLANAIDQLPKNRQGTLMNTLALRMSSTSYVRYVDTEYQPYDKAV